MDGLSRGSVHRNINNQACPEKLRWGCERLISLTAWVLSCKGSHRLKQSDYGHFSQIKIASCCATPQKKKKMAHIYQTLSYPVMLNNLIFARLATNPHSTSFFLSVPSSLSQQTWGCLLIKCNGKDKIHPNLTKLEVGDRAHWWKDWTQPIAWTGILVECIVTVKCMIVKMKKGTFFKKNVRIDSLKNGI